MNVAWDASDASEKQVYKLKAKLHEYKDKKAFFDGKNSQRCTKILELTKEIDKLEKQKVELGWEKSLPTQEITDQEATKGVEHVEVALNLALKSNL